jgi:transcriptional regulator of acetoin/glycerol metabolism
MRKYRTKHISTLKEEYDKYIEALTQADYNKSKAAKLLHIDRKTFYNKFKKFKEAGLHPTKQIA